MGGNSSRLEQELRDKENALRDANNAREAAQRDRERAERNAEQALRDANNARETAQRDREWAARGAEQALRDANNAREAAQRDRERAQRDAEQAQSDANNAREAAQRDRERAERDVEQAQRDTQQARDQAQQDSAARMEAERMEREAREREEEARQAREEAERTARSWEEAATDAETARIAADEARHAADEARQAAEERLMRGIPPEMRPTTEQMQQFRLQHGYGNHALNIAIVGEAGAGKSALLNAVRGLWPDEPGAAAVGVNETTAVVKGYVDPRRPQVKWFDVPGANTPNISGWLYFMDQNLYIFDALVILFSDRFTQTVGTLLSNAHRCGIPTFLVRSKADQLIQNLKNDHRGRRLNDAQAKKMFVDDTREMVNKNLNKLNLPLEPVFVVSVPGMREWVTEGDATNVIDEQVIYQTLFPESG